MTDSIKALIAAAKQASVCWQSDAIGVKAMDNAMRALDAAIAAAEARPEPKPDSAWLDGYYRSDCYPYWFRLCRKTGSQVMWGFSVFDGEADYRTLGCSLDYWRHMPMGHLRATIEPDRDRRCDRDLCRMLGSPEPAAEPSEVAKLIHQGHEFLNASAVLPAVRAALMALEALAREVRE